MAVKPPKAVALRTLPGAITGGPPGPARMNPISSANAPGPLPADNSARPEADLFTALRESLGLKLERREVHVQFGVIDHVQRDPCREWISIPGGLFDGVDDQCLNWALLPVQSDAKIILQRGGERGDVGCHIGVEVLPVSKCEVVILGESG